jgi:uncharacterized protein YjbI with pentapeptide repeats
MQSEDLKKIIVAHELWLGSSGSEGVRADLRKANLRKADLRKADLRKADLRCANLSDSNLSYANLSDTDLSWADLSYANLSDTNLSWADLSWADLSYANLSYANLSDTDLSNADFRGADLNGCIGNNREVKSIFAFDPYPIAYTADFMQIGCKNHKIEDWHHFSDSEIFDMDGDRALVFWRKNKEMILSIIAANPARPTKKEV